MFTISIAKMVIDVGKPIRQEKNILFFCENLSFEKGFLVFLDRQQEFFSSV